MRPDLRVFTDAHPHGTLAGYDTEPDLADAPDSRELHDLAEEMNR